MPVQMPLTDLEVPDANRRGRLSTPQVTDWARAARARRVQLIVSGVLLTAVGLIVTVAPAQGSRIGDPLVLVVWVAVAMALVAGGTAVTWRAARPRGDNLTRDVRGGVVVLVTGPLTTGVTSDPDGGEDEHWVAVGTERFAVAPQVWERLTPGTLAWSAYVLPRTRRLIALEAGRPCPGAAPDRGEDDGRGLDTRTGRPGRAPRRRSLSRPRRPGTPSHRGRRGRPRVRPGSKADRPGEDLVMPTAGEAR